MPEPSFGKLVLYWLDVEIFHEVYQFSPQHFYSLNVLDKPTFEKEWFLILSFSYDIESRVLTIIP